MSNKDQNADEGAAKGSTKSNAEQDMGQRLRNMSEERRRLFERWTTGQQRAQPEVETDQQTQDTKDNPQEQENPWAQQNPWAQANPWAQQSPWGQANTWEQGHPYTGGQQTEDSSASDKASDRGNAKSQPADRLVSVRSGGDKPPFFCVHGLLGSAFPYHKLALHMDAERPFYGLQCRGLDGSEDPTDTVEKMAEEYVASIRAVQAEGPYHLGGYSFGGYIAYEMARLLHAQGEETAVLAMLGTGVPVAMNTPEQIQGFDFMVGYMGDFARMIRNADMAGQRGPQNVPTAAGAPPMAPIWWVTTVNWMAMMRYLPPSYAGSMDLFVTTEQEQLYTQDPSMGWTELVDRVQVHAIGGNHLNVFTEPQVQELASLLDACLNRGEAHE